MRTVAAACGRPHAFRDWVARLRPHNPRMDIHSDNPDHGFQFPGEFELSAMGPAEARLETELPRLLAEAGVDLVHEDIPDLSRPTADDDSWLVEPLQALSYILKLIGPERSNEAVQKAIGAMLVYLHTDAATRLGLDLREAHGLDEGAPAASRSDYELIAHDEDHTIEEEQGHPEHP